ncbi:MAG: hypothetical protein NFCOHLIN_01069 [Gammaproteobacteria bacterium]|nr:hypothetical protein [Gammaproteobacteria bacterium]
MFGWLRALFERSPTPPQDRSPRPEVRTKPSAPNTYRPSPRAATRPIRFTSGGANRTGASARNAADLSGINDAFTGRRLDLSQPVYECVGCHVFYQAASVEVLREANSSRCMVCGSTQIAEHGKGKGQERAEARNYTPNAVALNNYREHIGQVITFTGYVYDVKQSRRGLDYAVMFERASWTKGLKMVAFRGGVRKLGGAATLKSYAGKTLTIRGLLIQDPIFGPEIIVDDPAMVIRVDS